MTTLIQEITVLRACIFFIFFFALFNYDKEKKESKYLFYCVAAEFINEFVSVLFKVFELSNSFPTTIYCIINASLWLLILHTVSSHKKVISTAMIVFLTFAVINLLFLQKVHFFNTYTFVLGSFLYLVLFIYDSYTELKKENLDYFTAINYLLITTPIIYFVGFSFIFAFGRNIRYITIYNHLDAYIIICYFVNFFYNSLIIFNIYKQKMPKNG